MQKGEIYSITTNRAHCSHQLPFIFSHTVFFLTHSVSMNCICCNQCDVTVAFWSFPSRLYLLYRRWKLQPLHWRRSQLFSNDTSVYIRHRHGCKWIFAFRPTLTTFFQSHIFLGSYEPFADNIINIKYCCSHQRKFSIIFQHFQSNGSIAMPWIPNILHFWMAPVLFLWIVMLFIFIFAGQYV